MKIREVKISDIGKITQLNKQLGYEYPEAKSKEKLSQLIKSDKDKIFVAVNDQDKVIGYIHGAFYRLIYYDDFVDILGFVVDEKYRGKDIGKALMAKLEEWAIQYGYKGLRLVTGEQREQAHSFYEKCGFTLHKTQKNYKKIF